MAPSLFQIDFLSGALFVLSSALITPLSLPACGVLVLAIAADHPVAPIGQEIVLPMRPWTLILIGFAPGVCRQGLLQIGAFPFLDAGIGHQGVQAFLCGRIASHVQAEVVQPLADQFDLDIFTAGHTKQDFSKAGEKLQRHIYDYVLTDSNIEREFVKELDTCTDVVVYAKLPRGFLIPTPVGDYNPDWAISFKEGAVKHVYFVAETKGSMSSMVLNEIEKTKIRCARKFFDEINKKYAPENVKYDVVNSFGKLMELVK